LRHRGGTVGAVGGRKTGKWIHIQQPGPYLMMNVNILLSL